MDRKRLLDGFQLYDQTLLDDEVDAIAAFESNSFIHDGQWNLTTKRQTVLCHFVAETFLIRRFQQPRA